jgi:capsular exopolysaccharide synthesis family protein
VKKAKIGRFETLDFIGNEAINTICSNLFFAGRNVKKILITSFGASEGKSFTVQQILWNLAKRGKRIVLIDADLRRSTLISRLGFQTDEPIQGLAHYLAGYCSIEDTLYETDIPNAVILPIGRIVKNPILLLGLPQFPALLDTLAGSFDIVLIDSPPLGIIIDAAEIAGNCDGAVIVTEYDKTRRRDLVTVRNLIEQTGCPILGCVINKVKLDTFGAKKYYGYSRYY